MTQLSQTAVRSAEEVVRLPDNIQQHGFFLLTESSCKTVLVASENAARFLQLPLSVILGGSLPELLSRDLLHALELLRRTRETERSGLLTYLGVFTLNGQMFSVTTHCVGNSRAVEFELQEQPVDAEMMNSVITNFVSTLARVSTQAQLCDAVTRQIADLAQFDRVLLYSFNGEGQGTVLSEVNNGRLPSYLGLRFPFSDVPQQAWDLYVLNPVRIISDVNYVPSPLMEAAGQPARRLDLSLSVLRGRAPMHLEYMRNMGTMCSMSISIVIEGRLWGLISGHHTQPKVVPYLLRSACDMLAKLASTQLIAFAASARLEQTVRFHAVQRSVLTEIATEQNHLEGLLGQLPVLTRVIDAQGVALVVDGQCVRSGETPDDAAILRITDWLEAKPELDIFVSSHLSVELPWAEQVQGAASGLLAVRISSVQRQYLLWFRPEIVQWVRWAGEPVKTVGKDGSSQPRGSFEERRQMVRGTAEPWTEVEMQSARDFRAALTAIGLQRAEEAVETGEARFEQLTRSSVMRIFLVDDSGWLSYVNERWREQGLRSHGCWFEEAAMNAEDAQRCAERWPQAVAGGKIFEAEVRVHPADGGPERWHTVRTVPLQRARGERAGWIGTFLDLTESKEREAAARMSEKLALTERMTSVIAHEINNPLEAITNLMYLLRTEMPVEGPAGSYIGMVESELERISGITKQTLRWNRESSNRSQLFSAGSLVEDVLRLFAGKIRNRQVTVSVTGNRGAMLHGVMGQIRQVLANLVSNAVDASPVGGQVRIVVLNTDGRVGFAVCDNGGGIAAAAQALLFVPFYSTKGDLGNGLGLYISREIMERHGGQIEVDSEVGRGTTMTMWLPAGDAAHS